jgi:NADPH:quinone reductase-like Zn-dependent oxidoreductase
VNGGGGSGSFAIQQAKRLGAHVTGVDNAGKLDHVLSLGADEVIDYKRDDFTRAGSYDLILDLVAERSVFAYRRALARGGRHRCVGGPVAVLLGVVALGWIVGGFSDRRIGLLVVKEGPGHFEPLAELCVAREIRIPIDRTFELAEVRQHSPTSVKAAPAGRSSSRSADRNDRKHHHKARSVGRLKTEIVEQLGNGAARAM